MRGRIIVILAVAFTAVGCSDDGGTQAGPEPTESVSAAATSPDSYAVGRRSIELVDASRPTAADPARDLPAEPDRTLPVLLLYPAEGDAPAITSPVDDAPVADGGFPLVVWSHGIDRDGPDAEPMLMEWARAGYIVAAPTFPLSSGEGGLIGDYVNQPADVSFVIDEVLALPADDPLSASIDAETVAAAGHSLGGITTIGLAFNSATADDRLDAAVEMSGMRLPFEGGEFDDLARVPFLAVHGGRDGTIPVSGSDTLFTEAPGPAAYLRFPDAGHGDYLRSESESQLVNAAVLAFLDEYLRGNTDAVEEIPALVEEHDSATFEVKPAA